MSLTNEILAFCPNNTGTNLESQAAYAADSNRTNGNQPGVASSMLNNKAIRQATYVASQMGEFLKTVNNQSVLDNATPAQLLQQMLAALQHLPPRITSVTATGSGTYNLTYAFFCSTATCAINDTYSDGTTTFTVVATLTAGTLLYASGATAPITGGSAGTLTKLGGAGGSTSSFSYYAVRAPLSLEVELVGPGGGGGGSTANNGSDGTAATTFGTTLLSAGPGLGGTGNGGAGGAGGSASLGGVSGIGIAGGSGGSGMAHGAITINLVGGTGGSSPYGGAGASGLNGSASVNASANSGSGGSGGASGSSNTGGGGGAGAWLRGYLTTVLSTYAYVVGAKGAGASAGGTGGSDGADGRITVVAKYQ